MKYMRDLYDVVQWRWTEHHLTVAPLDDEDDEDELTVLDKLEVRWVLRRSIGGGAFAIVDAYHTTTLYWRN
jgi:hypothetical protein